MRTKEKKIFLMRVDDDRLFVVVVVVDQNINERNEKKLKI